MHFVACGKQMSRVAISRAFTESYPRQKVIRLDIKGPRHLCTMRAGIMIEHRSINMRNRRAADSRQDLCDTSDEGGYSI